MLRSAGSAGGDGHQLPAAPQVDKRKLDEGLTFPPWKPREHPRLTMPLQQKRLRKRRRWAGNRWSNMRSIFSVIRDGDVLVQVSNSLGVANRQSVPSCRCELRKAMSRRTTAAEMVLRRLGQLACFAIFWHLVHCHPHICD